MTSPTDPFFPQQPGLEPASAEHSTPAERAKLVDRLFREHNRALVTFLTARLYSETEARDVAQEAYVRFLQLERTDAIGFHRAYLFRIAANLAVDRLRQRAVREKAPTREVFTDWFQQAPPEQEALNAAEREILTRALGELPQKTREAVQRHFLSGEPVASIAASWGLTDRMVRYYLARGLAHCRARLDGEGDPS